MMRIAITTIPVLILAAGLSLAVALNARAGSLSYTAIPATDSDAKSGISTDRTFTSAVAAGNATGNDHIVGGVTLFALPAAGDSATANDITVDATTGTLENGTNPSENIRADGGLREVLSKMISNTGASDGSKEEIEIDKGGLTSGKNYTLRVYITRASDVDREVNLSFAGDGQPAVETRFFNEDDATTSRGHFRNPNQAYYISYRFTWDGKTVPGVIITQKSGAAPFCLYAVTNQEGDTEAADRPAKSAKTKPKHTRHTSDEVASNTADPSPPPEMSPEKRSAVDKLDQNFRNGYMTQDAYETQRRVLLKNSND